MDTIVVPAKKDGFEQVFLGQKRSYALRIKESVLPQIKYVAAYQGAPISAITHIATVRSIEPWIKPGKYTINFVKTPTQINSVPLAKGGRIRSLMSPRYTTISDLEHATTMDDLW